MFKDRTDTLGRGDRAPEFELQTATGETISDRDLRGRMSLVFFLRGTW